MSEFSTTLAAFQPIRIAEVELSQPISALPPYDEVTQQRYCRALSLVRLHSRPLGIVQLSFGEHGLNAEEYAQAIWRALESEIRTHMREDDLQAPTELTPEGLATQTRARCLAEREAWLATAPLVTAIIATRNRTTSLGITLDSVLASEYPHFDIIVVDNAPSNDDTRHFIAQRYGSRANIRYVREDRPGLGRAHNAGLKDVQTPYVVFTDDDVVVDRFWLLEMVKGFSMADNVGCVTGLIMPVELETQAQLWIEQYSGFSKGFARRIFDLNGNRPPGALYPYTAGVFGSGASMAFDTRVLREMGGFDSALGAGTLAMGGDDLDAFYQVVSRGYRLVYEPAAILHHSHRREYPGLQRQAYGYGVGLTAFLMKSVIERPAIALDLLLRFPAGLAHILSSDSPKNYRKQADYPVELNRLERKGMLYGPLAYWRSRNAARKS